MVECFRKNCQGVLYDACDNDGSPPHPTVELRGFYKTMGAVIRTRQPANNHAGIQSGMASNQKRIHRGWNRDGYEN
jgi:hypothetical protein